MKKVYDKFELRLVKKNTYRWFLVDTNRPGMNIFIGKVASAYGLPPLKEYPVGTIYTASFEIPE